MHCIQCKDYNASFNALYPYYTILCIVFIYCILSIMLYAFYSMHLIPALYHCILCIVFFSLYSIYCIQCIVHFKLVTKNFCNWRRKRRREMRFTYRAAIAILFRLFKLFEFFRVWVDGDGYVEIYVC